MSELRPFVSSKPPLTGGARFLRGFHRVGIVAAIATSLIGLGISLFAGLNAQSDAMGRYLQAKCIKDKIFSGAPVKTLQYDKLQIDFYDSECYGPDRSGRAANVIAASTVSPAPFEYAVGPFFLGSGISIFCAGFTYFLFWLIGWLFAGFTRD